MPINISNEINLEIEELKVGDNGADINIED